jgi:cytochrome P450
VKTIPEFKWLAGSAAAFKGDTLQFYEQCERQAGMVQTHAWRLPVYVVTDPALIEEVLIRKTSAFAKSSGLRLAQRAFGNGLLTSDGPLWLRQRRAMQPSFHAKRLAQYRVHMHDGMARLLASYGSGGVRDIYRDMTDFCFEVLSRSLFGEDMTKGRPLLAAATAALHEFHEIFVARWFGMFTGVVLTGLRALFSAMGRPELTFDPSLIPTAYARRFRNTMGELDAFAAEVIRKRRARKEGPGDDLLGILLSAKDERGRPLGDRQIRDEVVTMFFAGHETGAAALAWAFYLLAQHPEVAQKLAEAEEGSTALADGVLREALRLYPPAYRIARTVLSDCEIGGYSVKKGAELIIPQWAVQRSARYFDQPLAFRPERWTPQFSAQLPRFAYFPFGGGPRTCIGNNFAISESHYVLSTVVRAYDLSVPTRTASVRPQLGVTLTPAGNSLKLKLRPRGEQRQLHPVEAAPKRGCPFHFATG